MSVQTSFSTFQTMVLEVYKRTDKTTEIKRYLNATYREMVAAIYPRKSQDRAYLPTVIGRPEYPLPISILRISHPIRLIDTTASNDPANSWQLDFLSKDRYDFYEPNPNAATIVTGRPWGYTVWKNSILVTKIPDKSTYNLEINMGGEATDLVGDTDITIFRPTWDETMVAGTLSRLYALIEDWQNAEYWQSVYRYGFGGNEGSIVGGLELLKKTEQSQREAPMMMRVNRV